MMMMMMVVVVAVSKANDASLRFVALANFWLLPTAGSREFVSLEHGKIIKAVLAKKKMLVNKSPTADKKKKKHQREIQIGLCPPYPCPHPGKVTR